MAYERTEASAELLDRAREGGSHLAPIEVVFEACLAEPIRRTHTWLGQVARLILLQEHKLLTFLDALRLFFLGGSADFSCALVNALHTDLSRGTPLFRDARLR